MLIERDGKIYRTRAPLEVELTTEGELFYQVSPSGERLQELVNVCECCGRGDYRTVVWSFDTARAFGLIVEVTDG